jgi:hypothetical protein
MVIREGLGIPNLNEDHGSWWDHNLEAMGEHILRGRGIYGARHGRRAERRRVMIARSWVD